METFVRTPYNYDTELASETTGLECLDPSMTQQQFKEECDINTIVERFGITGQLPSNVRMPLYGDFTDAIDDYQTALHVIKQAEESFLAMPAKVRERFGHEPQAFLEFVNDPRNRDEAEKLGLVVKPLPPAQAPSSPVAAQTPASQG